MNIRIDDDVPLPQPDKPDSWQSKPNADRNIIKVATVDPTSFNCEGWVSGIPMPETINAIVEAHKRYPAETTYDAKGVPTVDCFLVGGPLNGKSGPIAGTAKVVELDIYAADGSVSSVELYELGDRKELGCRYWKATKA